MKKLFRSPLRFVFIPIVAVAFLFLIGFLLMHLWNYTLPALLGVGTITLWQAMALFFLCKILFGFGGGPKGGGGSWRRRKAMRRKFDGMSDDEKARVRAYMRSRSRCWGDVADAPEKMDDNKNDTLK
jgi:hypothetical protein